jgi:phosphoenolpyruvate-protein phosphotransferase
VSELTIRGHPASPGAAVGGAWTQPHGEVAVAGTPDQECDRVRSGLDMVQSELADLAETLRADGHSADAEIVETNRMMAADSALVTAAIAAAEAGAPAAQAIAAAAEPHVLALAGLEDPTLAARAADLRAIARRAGELADGGGAQPPAGSVVVAEDLGPGDVAAWVKNISGIVLAGSASTAHAAIVARSLGIPLVTGAGAAALAIPTGEEIAVDADRGLVIRRIEPATRERLQARIEQAVAEVERGRRERLEPAVTTDGRAVRLLGNAGTRAEVEAALAAGAEGIGLLRTELGFLDAQAWPSEDAHVAALRPILSLLTDRVATVRTLDFGGDKTPPFLVGSGVENMLGPRGIRLGLARADEALAPQVRALLRVSGDAILRILVPMVTEAAEIDAVREIVHAARDAVAPGSPDPLIGAMIEVPAAALSAQSVARSCDFLSIGTNDLVQYTMAADRLDPAVADRVVAHHPAVLRLIARVVTAAHATGIPVDVCGEAAGDPEMLPLLVGLGVDELSVSPARIPATRRMIRALSVQRARKAAVDALEATTAAEVAAVSMAVLDACSGQRLEQPGNGVESL